MKVHHSLICLFFFLSLQDGNTNLLNDQSPVYAVTEGGVVTVECHLPLYEEKFTKFLCKETCEENILIETTNVTAERGRYRIANYHNGREVEPGFYATITQVTKSDSGQYRCGYNYTTSQSYKSFGILVLGPTSCLPADMKKAIDLLMYSVVSLVIIVVILELVLMTICFRRKTKPDGPMTRGNAHGLNIENPMFDNGPPVSASENSDYLTLHPATRDQNQIYSTLTNTRNT